VYWFGGISLLRHELSIHDFAAGNQAKNNANIAFRPKYGSFIGRKNGDQAIRPLCFRRIRVGFVEATGLDPLVYYPEFARLCAGEGEHTNMEEDCKRVNIATMYVSQKEFYKSVQPARAHGQTRCLLFVSVCAAAL
jgi:hypothetical protein